MNFVKLAIRVVLLKMFIIMLTDKASAQAAGCGGTFRNLSGSISSPNFPSYYNNNLNCFYYIESPITSFVDIAFVYFETESVYDWLQVNCSIGSSFSSQSFNGTALPSSFRIYSCSRVVIQFYTDRSSVYGGFNLTYEIDTCGTFRGPSGSISSYLGRYQNCYYKIELSPQYAVNITFIDFYIRPCCGWLQVNCSIGSPRFSQRFTGYIALPFLSIQSCSLVVIQVQVYGDFYFPFQEWYLRYSIGTGLVGGLTSKPTNAYVLTNTSEDIVLSCASRANQPNQYPWWSYSSDGYTFDVITASDCSLLSSTNSTVYNTTNDNSTRTCNLTISQLYVSVAVGVYTCTDSTLESASALVTVFSPILRMVNIPSFPSTEVASDDRFMVTCSIQVTQPQYAAFQVKPSLYLYSDEYQSFIVPSNATASIIASASQDGLPSIVCEINFTLAGDFPEGYATNQPQNIILSTPSQKTSSDENKTADKLNTMALIVGVVLGSTVLLLLVAVIVLSVCLYRRKNYVRDSKLENNAIEASVNERSRNNPRYEMTPRDTMFAGQGETATSGAHNVAYEDTNGETNTYEVLRRVNREP